MLPELPKAIVLIENEGRDHIRGNDRVTLSGEITAPPRPSGSATLRDMKEQILVFSMKESVVTGPGMGHFVITKDSSIRLNRSQIRDLCTFLDIALQR